MPRKHRKTSRRHARINLMWLCAMILTGLIFAGAGAALGMFLFSHD